MKDWNSVDYIVLILTTIISLTLLLSIFRPYYTGIPISETNSKLIDGLIASIISIISMYIGAKIQKNKDN